MNPKFSVLIPAYNAEKYIEECVSSCQAQNCSEDEIEIIIANDGSTDRTQEICERLCTQYNNVSVFNKKNEGQAITRNFLYKIAKGEYLLFMDADDLWSSDFISVINEAIIQYNSPDIICFGFSTYNKGDVVPYNRGTEIPLLFKDDALDEGKTLFLDTDKYNSIWSKAVKNALFENLYFPDEYGTIRQGEDKLLTISLLKNANSICVLPNHIYLYRIDNISMTRTFYPASFQDMIFVDRVSLDTMESLSIDSTKSKLRWAMSLVDKFYEFMVSGEKSEVDNKIIQDYYKKYRHDDTCDKAIKICIRSGNFRYKIKAFLVCNYPLFKIFQMVHIG